MATLGGFGLLIVGQIVNYVKSDTIQNNELKHIDDKLNVITDDIKKIDDKVDKNCIELENHKKAIEILEK